VNLNQAHIIHFLGIGGIGMSALARYFHREGKQVAGYDRSESVVTRQLMDEGIEVYFEPQIERIAAADLIVYTPALPADHPELIESRAQHKPLHKRAEVLGFISKEYKTLAIAGTHGKTTTSTMLAWLLKQAGINITAFLGGLSANLGGNFVHGDSDWVVVEADEYDRSFMHLFPEWSLINSLDPDHLDIYGTPAEMVATYQEFARQGQHLLLSDLIDRKGFGEQVETFGRTGTYRFENLEHGELISRFDFAGPNIEVQGLELGLPGEHNVRNMVAALALASKLGVHADALKRGVASFRGIYRRFELQGHGERLTFVDDYAHHPEEIKAAISTARAMFPQRQLMVVFQPHLYTRTRDFYDGFAEALNKADCVLLMDIYPARELPIEGVSTEGIRDRMDLAETHLVKREALMEAIKSRLLPPTMLLTLGAGDIDREVPKLKAAFFAEEEHVQPPDYKLN